MAPHKPMVTGKSSSPPVPPFGTYPKGRNGTSKNPHHPNLNEPGIPGGHYHPWYQKVMERLRTTIVFLVSKSFLRLIEYRKYSSLMKYRKQNQAFEPHRGLYIHFYAHQRKRNGSAGTCFPALPFCCFHIYFIQRPNKFYKFLHAIILSEL